MRDVIGGKYDFVTSNFGVKDLGIIFDSATHTGSITNVHPVCLAVLFRFVAAFHRF
jgi:hypothetical protein